MRLYRILVLCWVIFLCASLTSGQEGLEWKADDPASYLSLGVQLAGMREYKAALTAFDKALELNPDYLEAKIEKSSVLLRMKRREEAIKILDRIVSKCQEVLSGNAALNTRLGNLYRKSGEPEKAILFLEHALAVDSTDSKSFYYLGRCWEDRGDYNRAYHFYQRALAKDPDNMRYLRAVERLE